VRSTSPKSGLPFSWLESCIVVQADGRGSQDLPIDVIDATLAKSAQNWSDRTNTCGDLRLMTMPATGPIDVAADGRPVVVFRDQAWQRPGGMPHDPAAIGLTTVFHVSTPGQDGDATILDADIELNGVHFTFTTDPMNAVAREGTLIADLENTLTHELGHVQGLAHTCWDHQSDTPPLDDQGNPIPDCNGPLPQSITDTTMYPYSLMPGEISKRTLTDDDVNGVCQVYPNTQPQDACFQRTQGGCGMGGATGPAVPWFLAIVYVARSRFRSRSPSRSRARSR
jgi:hypothetical protein